MTASLYQRSPVARQLTVDGRSCPDSLVGAAGRAPDEPQSQHVDRLVRSGRASRSCRAPVPEVRARRRRSSPRSRPTSPTPARRARRGRGAPCPPACPVIGGRDHEHGVVAGVAHRVDAGVRRGAVFENTTMRSLSHLVEAQRAVVLQRPHAPADRVDRRDLGGAALRLVRGHDRSWYFSLSRYSSAPGRGLVSISSNAGP